MQNAQDAMTAMQEQALEAIKTGQAATLEAVKSWQETMAKMAPVAPAAPAMPAEMTAAWGDPKEIIDSVYDFAGKLLDLNKSFVHELLQASTAAAEKVADSK
ncbi:MAG TPA: hypothetical protein P5181_13605 [Dermatophilaceae bacterium]|nr:hypothetical protein [Dermatophilaceae bacterium]